LAVDIATLDTRARTSGARMQRASLVTLLIVTLLAGFTARAIFFSSSFPAGTTSGNANTRIGETFYSTLNESLSGGPIEPLAALLADMFRDHDPETGATRTAVEFLDDVRAMGASPQRIRLEPISVEASGESLVVGIDSARGERLQVAAMTVETALPGPHFETLRVVRGKIVDRWAPPLLWLEVANSSAAAVPLPALTEVWATLMRVTVSGGMAYDWVTPSAGFITVESGAGRWTASTMSAGDDPMVLLPGDFAAFSGEERVRLRSVDGPVTALLFITAPAPVPVENVPYQWVTLTETTQGVSRSTLWTGLLAESDSITRYRPGRIVVPPNATLELRHAQGIDTLIAIDGGVLELWSPASSITLLGSNQWLKEYTGAAQLDAGHAGAIVASETVTLRNLSDRPVALLVIAIERAIVAR
jgi:hypothetical protein